MISFAKGSASQGASYYEADSYYVNDASKGLWWGDGAKELGIEGEIKKTEFTKILNGYSHQKKALTNNAGDKKRVAYTDCCFSTPKSVSLLACHDSRIVDAHRKAIEAVLQKIEKEYVYTRRGKAGHIREKTGKAVVAKFEHSENREMEPHLHTHCVLMNITQGKDGKWRSVENYNLFKKQRHLQRVYDTELKHELHKIGYETVPSQRKGWNGKILRNNFEIKGVSENKVDQYSTRTKQINEGIKKREQHSEVERLKLYDEQKLKTRKSKKRVNAHEVRNRIYHEVKEDAELQAIKNHAVSAIAPELSAREIITIALQDISEQKAVFQNWEVLDHAMRVGFDSGISFSELEQECEKQSIELEENRLTTELAREITHSIINQAQSGRYTSSITLPEREVEKALQDSESKGVRFTKGQREAIKKVATSRDSINLIQGDAGSGKTFAVEHLKSLFEANGYTLRGFAPTGKASNELNSVGLKAETIDSFLLTDKEVANTGKEVWIVDETSMVGNKKLYTLLQKAKCCNAKVVLIGDVKQFQSIEAGTIFEDLQKHTTVTKVEMSERIRQKSRHMKAIVAFANDKDSHGAVNEMLKANVIKEITNTSKRLEAVSGELFEGKSRGESLFALAQTNKERVLINSLVREKLKSAGKVGKEFSFKVLSSSGVAPTGKRFAENYDIGQQLFNTSIVGTVKPGSRGVVTSINYDKNRMTATFQDSFTKKKVNLDVDLYRSGNSLSCFDSKDIALGVGDEILFLKNDKKLQVSNGMLGTVESLDDAGNISIRVQGKKKPVSFNINRDYNYLDYGYALTNYKSQGATVDKVICCTTTKGFETNANEFYVGVTRAKHDISFYTDSIEELKIQAGISQVKESVLDYESSHKEVEIVTKVINKPTRGVSFGM